jgi:hypothetical protein
MTPFAYSGNESNSVLKAKLLLTKLNYTFALQENSEKTCNNVYKVCTAMNCLKGPALIWFASKYSKIPPDWNTPKKEVIAQYCPTDEYETRQTAFKYNSCIQGNNNVDKYIKQFEEYRTLLSSDYENESATKDRFIQGLKPFIRGKICQHGPSNLTEAKFLARNLEQTPYKPFTKYQVSADIRGEPMDVDMIRKKFGNGNYTPDATNCKDSIPD